MTKHELTFLTCFTYLAILCTLSITYWLGYSVDTRLATLNYFMIMAPGFYFGVRLAFWRRAGKKARGRKKKRLALSMRVLGIRCAGVVLFVLMVGLLVHTILLWM